MSVRFIPVEKKGYYHIKDTKIDLISPQRFFEKQAIYVCEKLNELNSEVEFYQNKALELNNFKGGE